jgi:hypothetical protein
LTIIIIFCVKRGSRNSAKRMEDLEERVFANAVDIGEYFVGIKKMDWDFDGNIFEVLMARLLFLHTKSNSDF